MALEPMRGGVQARSRETPRPGAIEAVGRLPVDLVFHLLTSSTSVSIEVLQVHRINDVQNLEVRDS